MQNSGLIEMQEELKLSEKGIYLAKMIARRHRIVERFLSEILDLPWEQVYTETKKWENVLSSVTEEAMLKVLGYPKTVSYTHLRAHETPEPTRMPSSA